MKKDKNKKVTLEELASMVAKGFRGVDDKFDEIRLEMVTKGEFNSLMGEFNSLRGEFDSLNKKVDKLDYQVDEVYDILKRFEENDILNLQKRVQVLEKAVRVLGAQITK